MVCLLLKNVYASGKHVIKVINYRFKLFGKIYFTFTIFNIINLFLPTTFILTVF